MSAHCPACGRFAPFDTHSAKIHAEYCGEKMMKMLQETQPHTRGKLFPDRNIMHKQMGAAEDFPCCDGRGVLLVPEEGTEEDDIPDMRERYCACEAGKKRRELEL